MRIFVVINILIKSFQYLLLNINNTCLIDNETHDYDYFYMLITFIYLKQDKEIICDHNFFLRKQIIFVEKLLCMNISKFIDRPYRRYPQEYVANTNIIFIQRSRYKYYIICVHKSH